MIERARPLVPRHVGGSAVSLVDSFRNIPFFLNFQWNEAICPSQAKVPGCIQSERDCQMSVMENSSWGRYELPARTFVGLILPAGGPAAICLLATITGFLRLE